MTISSRIIEWAFDLPPVETRDIAIARNLEVPMPDGTTLFADHYAPRVGGRRPTILIRTPYGRGAPFGLLFGLPLAEQGFQVLIQSCRGTFGSGGVFEPFQHERTDGLATVAWLEKQPWFSGEFATLGPSYVGFTQWCIAAEVGPGLKAMATHVTSSEFRSPTYSGGSFWLDTALTWISIVHDQEKALPRVLLGRARMPQIVGAAARHLPLKEADREAVGETVPCFQQWISHTEPEADYWSRIDFSASVGAVTAPVLQVGGWYDIFLPQTLADYARLRAAGRTPDLTIGPWVHVSPGLIGASLRESIRWFKAHLLGDRSARRSQPVRLFVMGEGEWREFSDWPPPGYAAQRWHLQPGGGLAPSPPVDCEPDHYEYDPADPTPGLGGASLSANSGAKDNRALEARADVLLYTSAPLEQALEVVGPVSVELHVASSRAHTDFFARLCDVDASGKSLNVCDGLLRLVPGSAAAATNGSQKITFDLWPTAHRFVRGHRVRLQVSSGAHPRHARHPGSGAPLGSATELSRAEQTVFHDPAHPSAILLPVAEGAAQGQRTNC